MSPASRKRKVDNTNAKIDSFYKPISKVSTKRRLVVNDENAPSENERPTPSPPNSQQKKVFGDNSNKNAILSNNSSKIFGENNVGLKVKSFGEQKQLLGSKSTVRQPLKEKISSSPPKTKGLKISSTPPESTFKVLRDCDIKSTPKKDENTLNTQFISEADTQFTNATSSPIDISRVLIQEKLHSTLETHYTNDRDDKPFTIYNDQLESTSQESAKFTNSPLVVYVESTSNSSSPLVVYNDRETSPITVCKDKDGEDEDDDEDNELPPIIYNDYDDTNSLPEVYQGDSQEANSPFIVYHDETEETPLIIYKGEDDQAPLTVYEDEPIKLTVYRDKENEAPIAVYKDDESQSNDSSDNLPELESKKKTDTRTDLDERALKDKTDVEEYQGTSTTSTKDFFDDDEDETVDPNVALQFFDDDFSIAPQSIIQTTEMDKKNPEFKVPLPRAVLGSKSFFSKYGNQK